METHEPDADISSGRLRIHVEPVRVVLRITAERVKARYSGGQRDDIYVYRSEGVGVVIDLWAIHHIGLLDGSRVAAEHKQQIAESRENFCFRVGLSCEIPSFGPREIALNVKKHAV